MQEKLDPCLTGFSFEGRHAGPVEKLADTHVHYSGKGEDLEMLAKAAQVNRLETMFMIEWQLPDPARWLREVDATFGIGKVAVPFTRIDLRSNDPAQIDRAYDLGFWGLKWIGNSIAYDDHWFDPLLARAQELGMACLFHTGVLSGGTEAGAGMSLMRADQMDTVAKRYPALLIQGAHLGCPNIEEAVWGSEFCDNLVWDCSGGCRFHCQANPYLLHSAVHRRSRAWKSIMFGSDTTQGLYPPEHADGWPSKIEHRLAEWHSILAALPVPPTGEQLADFHHGNARRWMERIRANRKR